MGKIDNKENFSYDYKEGLNKKRKQDHFHN